MNIKKAHKRGIIALFFAVLFVLTIISFLIMRIEPTGPFYTYNPNIFNLIYYVPLTIWIAIFGLGGILLFLALHDSDWLSPKFTTIIMLLSLLLFFAIFYGLPYLVEPNPRFQDSWAHGETAKAILTTGHLNLNEFQYQGYPSSFTFLSILSETTGVSLTSWLHILPMVLTLIFFAALFFAINALTKNPKIAAVSTLIYGLSTYILDFNFSPAIFGWILFFLLIALLAKEVRRSSEFKLASHRSFTIVLLLILIGLATTHPVTQFLALSLMLTLFLLRKRVWGNNNVTSALLLLTIVIFSGWAIFFGSSYFSSQLTGFRQGFETVVSSFSGSLAVRPLQTQSPFEVANLLLYRRILYVLVSFTGLCGLFFLRKQRKTNKSLLLALLFASLLGVPLTLFGILPIERTIELAFIPLSVFSTYLIFHKKKVGIVILVFLVLTTPINFAAIYWDEPATMTHDWEVASAEFVANYFHGAVLAEFKDATIMSYFGNFSKIYSDYYSVGQAPDVFNSTFMSAHGIQLVYITQLTVLSQALEGNNLSQTFLSGSTFDCVYSNGYSWVIVNATQTPWIFYNP